ncbi:hypothetical protein [Micromonospora coxensis]|uniref:Uncharacterized protein n=1 Tax=Micromonospora coxensis TaxID=356852 RepID=A0A1C5HA17_9ACTN|nr:hypothetical protein [Micromonospora coxensis]SCG42727.1 hypothetical protein GA0070614_1006 [Micromonospora coxensis]
MPPRPAPRSWLARRLRDAADAAERWAAGSGPADADPPVDVPPRRPGQPPEHWLRLVAEHAPGLLRDLDLPPHASDAGSAWSAPSGVPGQATAPGHAPEPHPAGRATAAAHRPGAGLAGLAGPAAARPHDHRPDRSGTPGAAPAAVPRAGLDPVGLPAGADGQSLRRVVASGRPAAPGDGADHADPASEAWAGPPAGSWGTASSTEPGGVGPAQAGFPVRLRPAVPPPGWLPPGSAPDWLPPVTGSTPERGGRPGAGPDAGATSPGLPLPHARPGPVDAVALGLSGGPHVATAAHPLGSRSAGPDDAPSAAGRGSPAPHASAGGADRSGGVGFAGMPAPNGPDGTGTGRPGFSPADPTGSGHAPLPTGSGHAPPPAVTGYGPPSAGTGYGPAPTGTGYGPAPGHVPARFTGAERFPPPPSGPGWPSLPDGGPRRAATEGRQSHRNDPTGGEALLSRAAGPDGVPSHPDGRRVGGARVGRRPEGGPLPAGTLPGHPDDPRGAPPAGRPGPARPRHDGHHGGDDPDGWWAHPGDPWPALPDESPGPGRDAVVVSPGRRTTTARWWRDDPWPALPDDRDRRPAVDADDARWRRLDSEQRGA